MSKPLVSVLTVTRRKGWEELAQTCLNNQTFRDFEWIVVSEQEVDVAYIPAPPKTRKSNLSASNNVGLKACKGEYVVFYQDFIDLPNDCLQRLVDNVDATTFVTTLTINADGSQDQRGTNGGPVVKCYPEQWEENVAIAPMGIIKYLGGYDEEYDNGWAWNNCNLAARAAMLGCSFLMDQSNNPRLQPHDMNSIKELNGEFHTERMRQIESGEFPLRLNYL